MNINNKDIDILKRLDHYDKQYVSTTYISDLIQEAREEIKQLRLQRKDWATKILLAADAYIKSTNNIEQHEVYHQLYSIASPNFDKYSNDVWEELRKISEQPI